MMLQDAYFQKKRMKTLGHGSNAKQVQLLCRVNPEVNIGEAEDLKSSCSSAVSAGTGVLHLTSHLFI